MTWDELVASHLANRGSARGIALRSEDYSPQEVLTETGRLLQDASEALSDGSTTPQHALAAARRAATQRDRQRPAAPRDSLGNVAFEFARWLIARSDGGEIGPAAAAARDAASGTGGSSPLARDLVAFVTGYLSGAISEAARDQMLTNPRLDVGSAQPPEGEPPSVRGADALLREALRTGGVGEDEAALVRVWEAFLRFAGMEVDVAGDGAIDDRDGGDLLLFEWGTHRSPDGGDAFMISLVRQFSLVDASGQYSGMEQVGCTMWFDLSPERRDLGSDAIWSDGDRGRWAEAVAGTPGFASVSDASATQLEILAEVV